jgi:hypothetical protein
VPYLQPLQRRVHPLPVVNDHVVLGRACDAIMVLEYRQIPARVHQVAVEGVQAAAGTLGGR